MHIPLNPLEAIRIVASQFKRLPYPTHDFTGQTIIVTGANTGLGLEAARHFVRLNAARVILAVRDEAKGDDAARSIVQSTSAQGVTQVWPLDLSRRSSVEAFAKRVSTELDRLDVVVENAGMMTKKFGMDPEGVCEATITVNVINTLYLGMLLLPKLRETSTRFPGGGGEPRETVLTFVGSFVHFFTWFPERTYKEGTIFEGLAKRENARMFDRYNVSKMMETLLVRELAGHVSAREAREGLDKAGKVTVSVLNPGWVITDLQREGVGFLMALGRKLVARDTELGSRTLVHAAVGGRETHGSYLSDCRVDEVSGWVRSVDGQATQRKLWDQLMEQLERTNPDVKKNL